MNFLNFRIELKITILHRFNIGIIIFIWWENMINNAIKGRIEIHHLYQTDK